MQKYEINLKQIVKISIHFGLDCSSYSNIDKKIDIYRVFFNSCFFQQLLAL